MAIKYDSVTSVQKNKQKGKSRSGVTKAPQRPDAGRFLILLSKLEMGM
jgi:hypothetical protein